MHKIFVYFMSIVSPVLPTSTADDDEPTCDITGCCDWCSTGPGTNSCRGCGPSTDGECSTGQTQFDCEAPLCWTGSGNLQYGTWGNEGCT